MDACPLQGRSIRHPFTRSAETRGGLDSGSSSSIDFDFRIIFSLIQKSCSSGKMSKRARKEKVVVDPRRELNRSFLEAAYGGTIEEVKFYLDAGADLHYCGSKTRLSAVAHACLRPAKESQLSLAIMKHLVSLGCNVLVVGARGASLLHLAAQRSSVDVVRYLVAQDDRMVRMLDMDGRTALGMACERNDEAAVEVVRELLKAGSPVNAIDQQGRRALHTACKYSVPGVVRQLIRRGTHLDQGTSPEAPIFHALINQEHGPQILTLLIENGVETDVMFGDDFMWSLADCAIATFNPKIVRALAQALPGLELEEGHDLDTRDLPGFSRLKDDGHQSGVWSYLTTMHEARAWGAESTSVEQWVADYGSHPNPYDFFCMMRASPHLNSETMFSILPEIEEPLVWKYALDDGYLRNDEETILHLLLRSEWVSSRMPVLRLIAERYVNPFALNSDGCTAIQYLEILNDPEEEAFMLRYQEWSWCQEKTRWFGPLFENRAVVLMMCLARLQKDNGIYVPRDIREMLLKYLSRTELPFLRPIDVD